jgi:mycothiol synthase
MPAPAYSVRPFHPKDASDEEYLRLNELMDELRVEILPDDPPVKHEQRIRAWKNPPDFVDHSMQIAWNPEHTRVIAYGEVNCYHTGDNENVCDFSIDVHPHFRCQGIARQLLHEVVDFARQEDRTLMVASTNGRVPAGNAFMERLGARKGIESHLNQLKISDIPEGWVEKWLHAGETLSERFSMDIWDGPIPAESLAEVADFFKVIMNTQPRDQLEIEDQNYTPEIIRQIEKNLFAQGYSHWMLMLRNCSTGALAGMTEVTLHPDRPAMVGQGFTGVLPAHRGLGLGHWLKAAMLDRLLVNHPEAKIIRTGNANSNAPMLKINQEMGFKPYMSTTIWQVEVDKVKEYLSGAS